MKTTFLKITCVCLIGAISYEIYEAVSHTKNDPLVFILVGIAAVSIVCSVIFHK